MALRRDFSNSSSLSSSSSRLTTELLEFKDRLRPLGPGKVDLSRDDGNGLAALVLDNQDRRNGEGRGKTKVSSASCRYITWNGQFCRVADYDSSDGKVSNGDICDIYVSDRLYT